MSQDDHNKVCVGFVMFLNVTVVDVYIFSMETSIRPPSSTRRPVLSSPFGILIRIFTPQSLYVPPDGQVIITTCPMVRSKRELSYDDGQLTSSVKLSSDFRHMQHVINIGEGTGSQYIIAHGTEYDIMKRVSIVNRKVTWYSRTEAVVDMPLAIFKNLHICILTKTKSTTSTVVMRAKFLSQNLQYIGEVMSPDKYMLKRITCLFTGTLRKCLCVGGSDRTVIVRQVTFVDIS